MNIILFLVSLNTLILVEVSEYKILELEIREYMIEESQSIAFLYSNRLLLKQYLRFSKTIGCISRSTNNYSFGSIVEIVISSQQNNRKYELHIKDGEGVNDIATVCFWTIWKPFLVSRYIYKHVFHFPILWLTICNELFQFIAVATEWRI